MFLELVVSPCIARRCLMMTSIEIETCAVEEEEKERKEVNN